MMKVGILPRWAAGYLAVFLLLAASNFYAVWMLHELGARTIPSMNADIGILDYQKRLVDSVLSQLRYERKYLLMGDPGLYDQFLEANREFHRCLGEGRSVADTGIKKDFFDSVEGLHQRYEVLVNEEAILFRDHRQYDKARYRTEKDKASDAILDAILCVDAPASLTTCILLLTSRLA